MLYRKTFQETKVRKMQARQRASSTLIRNNAFDLRQRELRASFTFT